MCELAELTLILASFVIQNHKYFLCVYRMYHVHCTRNTFILLI